jgi:pilus assembly protein FimV
MASTHRMTLLALLLAGMGAAGSALAGLGPIHVLSSEGQPFEAEIPVVDEDPQGNVLVGLADRNKYPLVSTYSQSAPVLKFSAIRKPDGSIQKILVKGPSHFDEPCCALLWK